MENKNEEISHKVGGKKRKRWKIRVSYQEKLCLNRRCRSENEDIIIGIIQENIPELMIMIF